jgi:SsrA-binding protein
MKAKPQASRKIVNRRARHDYDLSDTIVAGLQLTGAETKALRLGHGQLQGAYVSLRNGELWLVNATIHPTSGLQISEDEQSRDRKLLAKQSEIQRLTAAKTQGQTIVPLELLTQGRYIKLRIAVGRGKKRYDKRQTLKKRQQQRDIERTIKK